MAQRNFRRWLDTNAGVDSYIHISGWRHKGETSWTLKLADCSRAIEIEFYNGSKKTSLKKLEILEEGLRYLRAGLEEWSDTDKD